MMLTSFAALSFDCYGTLIDWESGILSALRPWAEAAGLAVDDEMVLEAYAEQEARAEARHPRDPYPQILARAMPGLGERFGGPVSDTDAERFSRSVGDWPAFPDSPQALTELGQRFQLLVLSNVDRESFAASSARLGARFAAVITAEDAGSYKPSPRNFEALLAQCRRLGLGKERLLHVAQSLFHDHVPAKAAGLATVWINRRHGRSGWGATPPPPAGLRPDWEFPSLRALADAVAAERRA